ncbi:phytoene desaturase family protein [Paenibacillus radicis (ex Gao et al. 2016)]|uniref:4,4'-diaponeurosporene oxygenase n=1 Tax=Paenibacillus radicis (ex Gao et al. 2016) TaxID=1737354 RepID=A0A917H5Q0_9BACL|nr:phytoene desaturase family protein [Paenibacillus radicis (ex Gao et al. 2016)]GGG68863.1 diapolycopene oxygenase [Paenibacillus radicis (ex Gao et al. 2016)]
MSQQIVVIGGGLGGLSAAIRLASDGNHVTVLEKNERAGGKLNLRTGKGYSFDTGPSILTMPWVLEKLFADAGRKLEDYMTLVRVEPQWRTFFEDGVSLDISGDIPTMLEHLNRISPKDAAGFFNYLHYCQQMYELSTKSFFDKSLSGLNDLRNLHSLKELLAMDPLRSMHHSTSKFFTDKHLRQLFDFFIMYIGSSPYAAPAVLSQLVHVQMGLGIYYVEGGMHHIASGMLKLLDELNVEVRTQSEVVQINVKGAKAAGVTLLDGTVIPADLVVSNMEAIPVHRKLLNQHPKADTILKKLDKYAPSVSGLVLLLGVDKQYEQLLHHNFFFSENPDKEFDDIFVKGIASDDPTVYIGVSSKSDPTQAPTGKENLFVLTHVPPLRPGESFQHMQEQYREIVLNKLERMGLQDIRAHIEFEYRFIPDDLERLYGSNGGSIYGVVTDRKLNGGFKVPSQSEFLDNLYFVGGSTHPGGGVPMVVLSGQLTADLIKDRASTVKEAL